MDRSQLIKRLTVKEGCKLSPYQDSLGFWTCGVGHLLPGKPEWKQTSYEQVSQWLEADIDSAEKEAQTYSFYGALDSPRQNIVVELTFNLSHKLGGFHKFLAAMARKDYEAAGAQLKESLAYKEEPHRFDELIKALAAGDYP